MKVASVTKSPFIFALNKTSEVAQVAHHAGKSQDVDSISTPLVKALP